MSNLEFIKQTKMKLFGYAIGDIIRATRGNSLMGSFVQCFCFVGYIAEIARIIKPGEMAGDKICYKNFIEKYLSQYDSGKVYAIRCGLVHTYGYANSMNEAKITGYSFQHKNPENHRRYENNVYHLNLSNFIFDIIKATYDFFKELESKSEEDLFDYIQRIKATLTVNTETGPRISMNYAGVDSILSVMDSSNIEWKMLEDNIYQLCLKA